MNLLTMAGDDIESFAVDAEVCCESRGSAQVIAFHSQSLVLRLLDGNGRDLHHALTPETVAATPCCVANLSPIAQTASYPPPNESFGFHLDVASLAPGWYELSAAAKTGFIAAADGTPIRPDQIHVHALRIYVPRIPRNVSTNRAGGRFILLPGSGGHGARPLMITDRSGQTVGVGNVAARPLTFLGVNQTASGSRAVQFRVAEGVGKGEEFFFGDHVEPATVPGLYPMVDDAGADALATAYAGRRVWAYGDAVFYASMGSSTEGVTTDSPVEIVGIYRPSGFTEYMAFGTPNVVRPSTFLALDPLIVALRVPPPYRYGSSLGLTGDDGPNAYWMLYDAVDFERNYSLQSMEVAHPDWPEATRANIRAHIVKMGMTHDMIAWMFGYPTVKGTVAQLNRLDDWYYDEPTPTSFSVSFRHGRVVKYAPPGMLP